MQVHWTSFGVSPIKSARYGSAFADEKGTRWSLFDRARDCPRNCKRRAFRHSHWPSGREGDDKALEPRVRRPAVSL